jgi:hypothetical protein
MSRLDKIKDWWAKFNTPQQPISPKGPEPTPDPFVERGYVLGADNVYRKQEQPKEQVSQYRNPLMEQWLKSGGRKLKSDEILSGTSIASKEYGVPQDLLMDITGLESQAGMWDRPFEDYEGQYADEKHARGPFMFLGGTARAEGLDDRYSATESARATARKLKKGQLGEWDISDKPGAGGGRLTDWYSDEELAPYSKNSMTRRNMLQGLAKLLGY